MSSKKTHITAATLKSLRTGDRDYFIRDIGQRGFQIKVSANGKKTYQVEARLNGTGKVKKYKLGNVDDIDLNQAREYARDALTTIRKGIDPLLQKRAQTHEGKTLGEVITLYLKTRRLKKSTIEGYEYLTQRRLSPWLKMRVKDITKHQILDWYLNDVRKTPTQTEQTFRFLNSVMNYSKALEIISINPCEFVTAARVRHSVKRRTGHIEPNQDLEKFLIVFTKYNYLRDSERVARDLIALILTTGLRVNEARTLQWNTVDMARKCFTIKDTKNHRDHVVPMTPLTFALFRYRREHSLGSPYVFRVKSNTNTEYMINFQKTLNNLCEKAGIARVTPHDLRRTFATVLNTLDVGYADLKLLMNHKDKDVTTSVYIQPDIESLRGHLCRVVYYYDYKIPFFAAEQGCSRYSEGVLRFSLYGGSTPPVPDPLDNPMDENPQWEDLQKREFWGE